MSALQVTVRRFAAAPTFRAFRFAAFSRYWTTAFVALSAWTVYFTTVGYLAYDLTRDPFILGAVSFSQSLPFLLIGPFSGLLIDRVDRRNLLIATQLLQVGLMLALLISQLTGALSVTVLIGAALTMGAISAFDFPGRLTYVPSLVDRESLPSAVALASGVFPLANVLGPSIAGVLLGFAGAEWCFLIAAVGYLGFAISLTGLPSTLSSGRPVNALADLVRGYRYVLKTRVVFGLLINMLTPVIFGRLYQAFMPAVALDVLNVGTVGLGALFSAVGIGAFAGMLAVPLMAELPRRGRVIVFAAAAIGVTLIAFGLSRSLPISLLAMLGYGVAQSAFFGLTTALLQIAAEEQYRGRVMSLFTLVYGISPLGFLAGGWLATILSVPATMGLGGGVILLGAVLAPKVLAGVWEME